MVWDPQLSPPQWNIVDNESMQSDLICMFLLLRLLGFLCVPCLPVEEAYWRDPHCLFVIFLIQVFVGRGTSVP